MHARRDDIRRAIEAHQVVIVSGATGSGKSTQLPKICLEMGRGAAGLIGHTQPRRIAAQALANRVSAELGSTTGDLVGYQVRFVDRTSPRTLVKLMTDGLLLRELESDPLLLRYDTLIIDEAHERNLNVDFLLGVCHRLLPQRPDLRLIVTSATIETQRFAEFFGGAPIIDVEGQSYPVEVRYRPLAEEDEAAPPLPEAVRDALEELERDARGLRGDALVFLPGEKQILETRDLLVRSRVDWDVLPLYGRLTGPDQDKVFAGHTRRRVVLATNVAETSLTIPGVRFVIDAGLARVSRYSPRAKFQRLPIEPVSQASADQRRGRCGREGEGICIRLYAEDDYLARPRYTEPELLRTNLASLILQMAALALGSPQEFPFLDAPDARLLNDGYRLLQELGAVDGERRITRLGRQMAALPVDPRLARVLVEAGRTGCMEEALAIVSFLSIQDPRERPADKTAAADEKHALFADERSDFVGVLNLWRASREPAAGGNRVLRHWCREHFLSFLRMREWGDLREQLEDMSRPLAQGSGDRPAAGTAVLHQTLLTGFLGGIGVLDEARTYLGARDTRFVIAPGTPLAKRSPHWIVAASLVETHRLYARMVAQVQPSWIESAGAHLVKRTYGDAEWDAQRGMAFARETVSLYGRVLSSGRRVSFASVDPAAAQRMFVEEALVRRQPSMPFAFLERNTAMRARLERVESCLRRRDLLAGEDALVRFYLERIPPAIASTRAFEKWWRTEERAKPHMLDAAEQVFLAQPLPVVRASDYPATLDVHGNDLQLHYRFDATAAGRWRHARRAVAAAAGARRTATRVADSGLVARESHRAAARAAKGSAARNRADSRRGRPAAGRPAGVRHGLAVRSRRSLRDPGGRHPRRARAGGRGGLAALAQRQSAGARRCGTAAQGQSRSGQSCATSFAQRPVARPSPKRPRILRGSESECGSGILRPGPSRPLSGAAGCNCVPIPGSRTRVPACACTCSRRRVEPGVRRRAGIVRLAALALPQQHELARRHWASDREFTLLLAGAGFGKELLGEIADRAVADAVLGQSGELPRTRAQFEALVERGRADVVDRAARDRPDRESRAAGAEGRARANGPVEWRAFRAGAQQRERPAGRIAGAGLGARHPGWLVDPVAEVRACDRTPPGACARRRRAGSQAAVAGRAL